MPAIVTNRLIMPQQNINLTTNYLELNIRQANCQDLDLLVNWTYQLHLHEDDKKLAMHKDFKLNLSKWIQQQIDNPDCLFLIAEVEGNPVGFISGSTIINDNGFLLAPIKGLINLLWVEVEYRKQQIAEKLVLEIEKCFASIGITYIECHYTANNNLAQSFWENKQYLQSSITARKILK